jgi:hypothetical protein
MRPGGAALAAMLVSLLALSLSSPTLVDFDLWGLFTEHFGLKVPREKTLVSFWASGSICVSTSVSFLPRKSLSLSNGLRLLDPALFFPWWDGSVADEPKMRAPALPSRGRMRGRLQQMTANDGSTADHM